METKAKTLSNLNQIEFKLNEPQMNTDLNTVGNLTLLLGQNGSGKTFILKCNWLIGTQLTYTIISKANGLPFKEIENAQFLMDNTFDDQYFDGSMKNVYSDGSECTIVLEKGRVVDVISKYDPNIKLAVPPMFLSSETRLINDIVKYMKMKDLLGFAGQPINESNIEKLLKYNKIYDIYFMEKLFYNIKNNTTPDFLKKLTETINEYDDSFGEIKGISIKYDDIDILYIDSKDSVKSLTTLGSGHQALFTIFMSQLY